MKTLKAGSVWLLACLAFIASCNDHKPKPDNLPHVNENPQAANSIDSSAAPAVPQPGDHRFIVEINKMKFVPDQLTVHKGDTVVWINNDLTNHCVTDTGKAWTSSTIVPGRFWTKVFTKNADYFCAIHVVMKGKIQVE
ncbi:plastocyanin/azurin family copper-binding protein [Flavisolibacter ginsenosidimutans]|nr:plastocyanin/azurin family copper-binding protein [Flavisolibacter ginsenosidimutans]